MDNLENMRWFYLMYLKFEILFWKFEFFDFWLSWFYYFKLMRIEDEVGYSVFFGSDYKKV